MLEYDVEDGEDELDAHASGLFDPVVPPPRTRFAGAGRSRNNCTVYEAPLRPGTPYSTSTAILAWFALSSLGTRYLRA